MRSFLALREQVSNLVRYLQRYRYKRKSLNFQSGESLQPQPQIHTLFLSLTHLPVSGGAVSNLSIFFFSSITSRGIFQSSTKRNHFCAHITLYNLEKFARLTWLRKSPGPLFTSISNRRSLCFVQRMSTMTSKENSPAVDRPAKLEGRAFYESIGSPKFIVAPMVDQSEFVCYSLNL